MKVIPALDIAGGKAVRIVGGKLKIYGDPYEWVNKFDTDKIHIIDIDAALGNRENFQYILSLLDYLESIGVKAQVGGGVRSIEKIKSLAERDATPILGTMAYNSESFLREALKITKVIVAVDTHRGEVMEEGWKKSTKLAPQEALRKFSREGIETFLVTAIERDGTLKGYSDELSSLPRLYPELKLIYAGGISSIRDLEKISETGFSEAVVGRAVC